MVAQMDDMKTYYGTKKIVARPMTRGDYNTYRGWKLPENENGSDAGYLVEYCDGGASNDERHEGYISWSPEKVFEAAYQPTDQMNFGHALAAMKDGKKVGRSSYPDELYFYCKFHNNHFRIFAPSDDGGETELHSFTSSFVLADDWKVIE